jgi:hypothetical protein
MPIVYDEESGDLAVASDHCGDCGQPLYDTGCDALGCNGYCCFNCGTGCDIDLADDGRCATALAEESDEDYTDRVNAERAAWGLSPIQSSPDA